MARSTFTAYTKFRNLKLIIVTVTALTTMGYIVGWHNYLAKPSRAISKESREEERQSRPSSTDVKLPYFSITTENVDPLSQREKFCPPLPTTFPANVSFFPCDWDIKNVTCKYRLKANLVCNETSAAILFEKVPSGTPPHRVQFNDECLDQVIRTHCHDDGFRVPRLLSYVTMNKNEFPFFWFLSVLSGVRFVRPCLVLFHGDHLPFGTHWEALLQLVPHVVHVARDQPTSIFGHRIRNKHHRTDVIRLEAVKS